MLIKVTITYIYRLGETFSGDVNALLFIALFFLFPLAAPLGLPKGAHVVSMVHATTVQMNLLDEINDTVKADCRAPF